MSYSKRLTAAITLFASLSLARGALLGQDDLAPLSGAAVRISEAERRLDGQNDYWVARERLAKQALRLAETDLNSKDAEQVLQCVLHSPRSSPAAMQAAKYLAKHHRTSKSTIQWLFNQQPRE